MTSEIVTTAATPTGDDLFGTLVTYHGSIHLLRGATYFVRRYCDATDRYELMDPNNAERRTPDVQRPALLVHRSGRPPCRFRGRLPLRTRRHPAPAAHLQPGRLRYL